MFRMFKPCNAQSVAFDSNALFLCTDALSINTTVFLVSPFTKDLKQAMTTSEVILPSNIAKGAKAP